MASIPTQLGCSSRHEVHLILNIQLKSSPSGLTAVRHRKVSLLKPNSESAVLTVGESLELGLDRDGEFLRARASAAMFLLHGGYSFELASMFHAPPYSQSVAGVTD